VELQILDKIQLPSNMKLTCVHKMSHDSYMPTSSNKRPQSQDTK